MKVALLAAILALLPAAQDTDTFTDSKLGLSFTYPKTWTKATPSAPVETNNKKGKKGKKPAEPIGQTFLIPLEGSSEPAELLVMRTAYSGSAEDWNLLQETSNKMQKREVARQWQQDILGVPMLLTRINFTEVAGSRTTLAGLFYTHSAEKLLFRLTASAGDFDRVQFEFMKAMETLHTVNGELPKQQIPDQEIVPEKPKEKVNPRDVPHELPTAQQNKPKAPKVAKGVPLVVGSTTINLVLPSGWTAKASPDGFSISHPKCRLTVNAVIKPAGESDRPDTALQNIAGTRLADYEVVKLREDQVAKVNHLGCSIAWVSRIGSATAGGNLTTLDGYAVNGNYYLLMSTRSQEKSITDADLRAVRNLLENLHFEIGS